MEEEGDGGDFDKEMAEAIFPIVKWAHIIGTLGRIVLLAISYKKPRVCRMYFFYELMMMMIDQCLPRDINLETLNFLLLLLTTLNFFSMAYDYWPNLVACSISQVIFTAIRASVYNDELNGDAVLGCFFNILWSVLVTLCAHVVITSAGLLFVEAEILRQGNDSILDGLKEGVIILSEDTSEIHYWNRAAKNMSVNCM